MKNLRKEFEKETSFPVWINADIYPDGKIYTREYTEWLETRLENLSKQHRPSIEVIEVGYPKSLIQRTGNATSELIKTEDLIKELMQ